MTPESTARTPGYPIGRRTLLTALAAGLALGLEKLLVAAQPESGAQRAVGEGLVALRPYTGVYRLGADHLLGIDGFISDAGESTLLFCEYQSGVVRPMFQVSPGKVHFALEDGDSRPSKWNTLRALRVLGWYDQSAS